jgi:GT2 family glycosyltransferase
VVSGDQAFLMKVAAVIPHWNRAELLRTLLENLRLQTRPFDEVIVADNGSTDGSAELAEQTGARVIRLHRNHGFAVAVNCGIEATQADWVAILNNDVTLDPAWLERLLSASMNPADVRAAALTALDARREEFLTEYTRRFANVLNADHAAELFPEYAVSLESRARFRVAVHPAAQWIRDELFDRALANPHIAEIIFTAGGNGAGKTSGAPRGDIIYDSTLNNADHAEKCIARCLHAGKTVVVAYTYRPIHEAFLGVLHRAATQGRTVAIDTVIKTHTESAKTSALLADRFANVREVSFRFVDNSAGGPRLGDVALTAKENYASKRDELYGSLESHRGRIAEHLYAASEGSKTGSAGGPSGAGNPGESPQAQPSRASARRPEIVSFATGKILSAANPSIIDGTWDEISRGACAVRIGAGSPDAPEWNTPRTLRMASLTACLVRRSAWMPLDERFESYLEDVDLGLRCSKAGLEGVYEPSAVAYHLGSSTWGKWNPDTVRLLSRNQVLLTAKHFQGQPWRPIVAGQLLWGLVALRHGCGWAWFRGKLAGLRLGRSFENHTNDAAAFTALVRDSEAEILARQRQLYWRVYSWLAPR